MVLVSVARQAARRIVPLFDRILVSRVVAPTKSIGGVLLPESSMSKLNEVLFTDFHRELALCYVVAAATAAVVKV
jgi:hypothetical protein